MVRSLAPVSYASLWPLHIPECERLAMRGKTPYIVQLEFTGAATDAEGELVSGYTAEFNGTTTPADLHLVSASADDDNAADGNARSTYIAGVNAAGTGYTTELLAHHATDGTETVDTTATFQRFLQAWNGAWGSAGADAAGNITILDAAAGNVNGTIAAGANETTSTRFWLACGWKGLVYRAVISNAQAAAAGQNPVAGSVRVRMQYNDTSDTDRDVRRYITFNTAAGTLDILYPFGYEVYGSSSYVPSFKFYQEAEDGDLLPTLNYAFTLIIWDEN